MVAQYDDGYQRILLNCTTIDKEYFSACVRGTITGLLVNGVSPHSFDKALTYCADERVAGRDANEYCYQRLGIDLSKEYKSITIDCSKFPSAYRRYCPTKKLTGSATPEPNYGV
jgi:hypothetical protein